MRATEFILEGQPKLRIDNPGGDWLQGKIDYAKEQGPNEYGKPLMSTVTGSYNGYVQIPIGILKNIPGSRGEQHNVRQENLLWLMDYMENHGRLPPGHNNKEYVPFILVGYDGQPWVSEGNHRIMAAIKLNWPSMPIELRYFDGGERVDGILHPDKVAKMN